MVGALFFPQGNLRVLMLSDFNNDARRTLGLVGGVMYSVKAVGHGWFYSVK